MTQRIISFDTETYRIGPGAIAPKIICATFAERVDGEVTTWLLGNHPDEGLEGVLQKMLTSEARIVTHNGGYDYACVMSSYPNLIPLVFNALESGRLTDTLWREKLLNLSTTGRLEGVALPDGSVQRILYSLADLEMQYFGRDRTADKTDLEESWRANYSVLDGWHSSEYPEDAAQYALEDAEGTLLVYEGQEARLAEWAHMASMQTQEFQLASSFALQLMTAWGMATDQEAVEVMAAEVQERLDAVEGLLVEQGFLRPAVLPAPHKSQMKRVIEVLGTAETLIGPWDRYRERLEAAGIKFTAGKESSKDTKAIQAYVAGLFQRLGKIPEMTAGGSREPQIKMDAEVQEMLAQHDPLMAAFQKRESLSKLVGQQIPLLRGNEIVYPRYDALKETGRTSSYGNPKGKPGLFPAVHIQGVPNEIDGIDPRQCYVPREGTAFFDVDVTALELACVGQITYELFGQSVHRERYNDGYDLHAYLGSGLLAEHASEGFELEFVEACRDEGILGNPIAVYESFLKLKGMPEGEATYKRWRSFAKPTGLGFPGGLGPETMVTYARKTYNVDMSEDEARAFREMWRAVYPEMPKYFDWVNGQTDQYNDGPETLYEYVTPLGMLRRGATFCATANGKAMQSPGAEGMKIALFKVARECYDPTQDSVLLGCRPIAFIHDQILGETTRDRSLWHDQCMRVRQIVCESLEMVLPDIKMRSDEAHLTSVWSKRSKPTFGSDGKLIPWTPTKEAV